MRIQKHKLYVVQVIPGISGFKEWDKRETRIVPGRFVRGRYTEDEVVGLFKDSSVYRDNPMVRVEDGHLPDFQPTMKAFAYVGNFAFSGYMEAVVLE